MDPWSVFWRQGHSTTFGDYFKGGYDGPVGDWWKKTIAGAGHGNSIVEVGCGNCSLLPELIHTRAASRYVGVDIASVGLSSIAEAALQDSDVEVVIHSETPAEHIPEDDASADLVASVFGIEYSDLSISLPESMRLLRPGGKFVALMHHHDSLVTKMSRRALSEFIWEDIESVLNGLSTISDELEHLGDRSLLKQSYTAEVARQHLNQMADKYLSDTDPNTANAIMFEFMTAALNFFRVLTDPGDARTSFIESLRSEYTASEARFEQMVSVALNEAGIDNVESQLTACGGISSRSSVVRFDGEILAWELCTEKRF